MPKATQIRTPTDTFKTPECWKGGVCPHCGKENLDYKVTRIGGHAFCNYSHYIAWRTHGQKS